MVIGGYTLPVGNRRYFDSLLVGYQGSEGLLFTGKVGTGFSDKLLASLHSKFQKFRQLGWRDAGAKVLAISDSNGNQYQLAGGAATLGANPLSQSVYYRPSVNAGSDAVTVIFSQLPSNPDVRILEYSGFSALDVNDGTNMIYGCGDEFR